MKDYLDSVLKEWRTICHTSKRIAKYYPDSGIITCKNNGQAATIRQNTITSLQRVEGVTKELKGRDPMEWTQRMNWIATATDEIVISETVNC